MSFPPLVQTSSSSSQRQHQIHFWIDHHLATFSSLYQSIFRKILLTYLLQVHRTRILDLWLFWFIIVLVLVIFLLRYITIFPSSINIFTAICISRIQSIRSPHTASVHHMITRWHFQASCKLRWNSGNKWLESIWLPTLRLLSWGQTLTVTTQPRDCTISSVWYHS